MRGQGAGGKVFLSVISMAAVEEYAFILAAIHLAAMCGRYTMDNWIDHWVKKKGSEYSVKSIAELKNHWVCLS